MCGQLVATGQSVLELLVPRIPIPGQFALKNVIYEEFVQNWPVENNSLIPKLW